MATLTGFKPAPFDRIVKRSFQLSYRLLSYITAFI